MILKRNRMLLKCSKLPQRWKESDERQALYGTRRMIWQLHWECREANVTEQGERAQAYSALSLK